MLGGRVTEIKAVCTLLPGQGQVSFDNDIEPSTLSSVAKCGSIMLNCSQPNTPSLLEALEPVFKLNSIRPVMNMSTLTNVSITFTLFNIFGVVRHTTLTLNQFSIGPFSVVQSAKSTL